MSETFAPATVLEGVGDVRAVQYGDDSRFLVEFYTREVEDEKETELRGRRIMRAVPYCRKRAMGDPRTVWDAPVSDADKMRWPSLWAAYERGEHDMIMGTPLDSWPLLSREARLLLKNWGFRTVEQLVEVTDGTLLGMDKDVSRVVAQVREHAKKFIADQESGEQERRLARQLEERDNEIGGLKNQVAQLSAMVERMNTERLAGAVVPQIETAPGFQPPEPPQKSAETQGLADLEALPQLEPVAAEGDTPVLAADTAEPVPGSPAPFKRKLSDADIMEIRQSDLPNKQLAEIYKVSVPTITKYRKQ